MPRTEEDREEVLEYTIPEIKATYAFARAISGRER